MKKTVRSLWTSALALVLCVSMLLGTTFAWFTDSVSSDRNTITAGNLDIELEYMKENGNWKTLNENTNVFKDAKWEPGYTEVVYLRITNAGELALKYMLNVAIKSEDSSVNVNGVRFKLSEFIKLGTIEGVKTAYADRDTARDAVKDSAKGLREGYTKTSRLAKGEVAYVALVLYIPEEVGNEANHAKGERTPKIDLGINLVATQADKETDGFGDSDYDAEADFPALSLPGAITVPVQTDENGALKEDTVITSDDGAVSATVPAGVKLKNGATALSFLVSEMAQTGSNVKLEDNEILRALNVHIEGVAEDNGVPMIITVKEALMPGLNLGNFKLYHVEDGADVAMVRVNTVSELTAHNTFVYDPATGDVTLAMASFSEVTLVADTENAWEGTFDYTWYNSTATELLIANADQLAAFGAIVGGMPTVTGRDENGYTYSDDVIQDGFDGKTVKLIADINLGDAEAKNDEGKIFYPIGYWNYEGTYEKNGLEPAEGYYSGFYAFEGTFDGNGNTIKNFYQNTWEMKGDHDWYDAKYRYFRDGFGLFGKVYGGTVKNLIVDNYSCDSEIGTAGVIAAYADSKNGQPALFENITITNSNPRVYNIGNGGIVGCAGWYSRNDTELKSENYDNAVTFRNITVDQTNKISALWGSWGVSCAGILGQYYPDSACGIKLENCHVAAIIDVNNDVCSNYQYYWYRYAGMFIGTIRSNTTDNNGYTVADTTGVFAEDCTYTMGNWNEYWYCEIVANSIASYTHDHQFSRLDNITDISEIQNADGTWKKEGHFALLSADRKSVECYHIFKNSNGELYQHFHDVADESNPNIYETFDLDGNGLLDDLKEDRQRYFIPFNQLLTGLDMGIKAHTEFEGITFVEDGTVKSEVKFESIASGTYKPGQTIALGALVKSIADESKIAKATLYATVSPAVGNDNTKVDATFALDAGNWQNSSITFGENCTGALKIVITDYFYCTPTVIILNEEGQSEKFDAKTVTTQNAYTQITLDALFAAKDGATIGNVTATVTDPNGNTTILTGEDWASLAINLTKDGKWTVSIIDDDKYCAATTTEFTVNKADAFIKLFDKDFLYRVGNAKDSTVALGTLFKSEIATLANVSATIKNVAGNASGTFTSATTWTSGTIQFTGTGVVKVTISADGANSVEINLEVVDAVNVTTATSATKNNVVLLNDCGFSSLEVSGGYTLYGNGFTMTCASDSAALDMGYSFVTLNNGTLDNVQIVCPNFDYAVLYKSNMTESGNRSETTDRTRYYNVKSGVMVSGNSQILNSRISGGRAAVNVTGGNCLIDNSRIELGAVASLLVGSANSLMLRDVTLVQKPTASTYDSSKTLMGFSTLFICDADGNAAPVTLEGTLVQNAWIDENDKQYVPSAGQSIISTVLGKTEYLHDIDGDGTKESLNLGFAYMPESLTSKVNTTTITDNRTNKDAVPYDYAEVSILNGKTYVYSYKNTNGTDESFVNVGNYNPNKYGDIITVSYSDTADGLTTGKSFGTDGWVYELNVDLDKLSGYKLDFSKISMSVNGVPATDFKVNGNAKPTTPVAVTAGGVTYTLTATIDGKEYTATYKVTGTETSKESPSKISGPTTTGFGVAKSYGGDWSGAADVLTGVKVKYWSVADNKYIEFDFSNFTVPGNAGKLNGTNSYWEYTHTNNDFTLKVTNTVAIHSGKSVYGMPIRGTDGKLYFTISSTNGYVGSGTTSRAITMQYEFTDNNGGEKLTFTHTFNISYSKDEQYSYSDLSGSGKLTKLGGGGDGTCLAEGTLITLADGTKKAVEDLRKGDLVMTVDHLTGEITYKDVIIVVKTHSDSYYKNTFYFDDGTSLATINEHGIFDLELNKYVNIDHLNYQAFIGHRFVSIDTNGVIGVKTLVDVVCEQGAGYKYDIVTNGTLNYVAEDTLSVTHVLVDVINSFDFGENLIYDAKKMLEDIEFYGLYSYDEWEAYCDISVFDQYNIPVMKVGISKGLYTKEYIIGLINTYVLDDSVQIID